MRMQRLVAAREGSTGREILTLPFLAARLAGGFVAPVATDVLYPAIQAALAAGGFQDLGHESSLPGMPRAVLQSLTAVWRADIDLSSLPQHVGRFADLCLLETRIRERLPASRMLPRDLRDAALARASFSTSLLRPVTLDGIVEINAVWRPLLNGIAQFTGLSWNIPAPTEEQAWFKGTIHRQPVTPPATFSAEASAGPKSEVVEALRWVHRLLSSGEARAKEIGIAATSTTDWDDHFLAYANSAGLPLHFSHGIPAPSTPEGQACAALADVLRTGLSQERIWRLIRPLPPRPFAGTLPKDWFAGIPRGAGLRTLEQWREALIAARSHRADDMAAEGALLPILELLARGPEAGQEAGRLLLSGASLAMWNCGARHHTRFRFPCRQCGCATAETRRTALCGAPLRISLRARDRSRDCLV